MEQAGEAPDDRVQDAVARNRRREGRGQGGLAAGRPGEAGAAAAGGRGVPGRAGRGHPDAGGAEDDPVGQAAPQREERQVVRRGRGVDRRGRRTWWRARRRWAMWSSTRRRTSPPCSTARSGRRCTTGSATVLGDIAQGTTPWATRHLGGGAGPPGQAGRAVEELTQGFRVPREVIAYASRLLPAIAPDLTEADLDP